MNSELQKWLEGVDAERRQKARANQDVRTEIAEAIRQRIADLTKAREKAFGESGQHRWMALNRDEKAFRIDEARGILQMIVGVRD
jgi:hypothetical protein